MPLQKWLLLLLYFFPSASVGLDCSQKKCSHLKCNLNEELKYQTGSCCPTCQLKKQTDSSVYIGDMNDQSISHDENVAYKNGNTCEEDDVNDIFIPYKELFYEKYPWFQHYMTLYRNMLIDRTIKPKFAIYKKHKYSMGWGNRLRGKLSTFILALVTGRIFIQDHQMFTENFEPPLIPTKDGKSLVPLKWNYSEQSHICENGLNFYFQNKELEKIGIKKPSSWNVPAVYLDWLKTEDFTKLFEDFDCIEHNSPASFDARIYVNEHYKKKLDKLFGTPSRMKRMQQVFHFLTSRPSRTLLDASKSLASKIGFYDYAPSHRVGIQARLFFDVPPLQERLWKHIDDNDDDSYLPCVKRMLKRILRKLRLRPNKSEKEESPPLLLFLTTDDEKFKPFLQEKLKKFGRVVYSNDDVVHTSKISQTGTNSAIVEWYMLGQTSTVMTTGSSYGTTVWGIKGELQKMIGTPHSTWGPPLCGYYPDKRYNRPEQDIKWGQGGDW